MTPPAMQALSLPTVKSVNLNRGRNGRWSGTAWDSGSGTEFDVVQLGRFRWYVSDDGGVRHHGRTLKRALSRAVKAQEGR